MSSLSFSPLAFTSSLPLSRPVLSRPLHCSRRRARTTRMTLQPKDCGWREDRDLKAIESEFLATITVSGEVDADMPMLRERIQILGTKEKQWAHVCTQFLSLSLLTGIPLINAETGEPTARAWLFLSLSAAVPLYVVCVAAQLLHSSSVSFSHMF